MGLEEQQSYRRKEKRLLKRLKERMKIAEGLSRQEDPKGAVPVVRVRLWILLLSLLCLVALLTYLV
ncbi:hypothetical protein LCGC14_2290370 [marine sediment metagenome]|uniref:Uncharacterized protein n=1 Tax=marine sediment metagenome TaxID=412755 RepID=A0A0F9F3Y8_9ZZZZ